MVRLNLGEHAGMEAEARQQCHEPERQTGDDDREHRRQLNTGDEPPVTLVEAAGAVALRDEGVERQQQPHRENHDANEDRTADAHRADGLWTERAYGMSVSPAPCRPTRSRRPRCAEGDQRPEFLFEIAHRRQHAESLRAARRHDFHWSASFEYSLPL